MSSDRTEVGAFITDGEHLYEVVCRRTVGTTVANRRQFVILEDCLTLQGRELALKDVLSKTFSFVRSAAKVI